jgi:hypothetical protein
MCEECVVRRLRRGNLAQDVDVRRSKYNVLVVMNVTNFIE